MTSGKGIIPEEFFPPFHILEPPDWIYPVILSVPHSGSIYPQDFIKETCHSKRDLRQVEDAFVDELFQPVQALGIPLIKARFPRVYLDLNRSRSEFDPQLYETRLPSCYRGYSAKVYNGLGIIPRTLGENRPIYKTKRNFPDDLEKVKRLYEPYHTEIERLLQKSLNMFGFALLVDCHSMPSRSEHAISDSLNFVLGDRYGRTCHPSITDIFERAIQNTGYLVQRNHPYAGGYITEHYGQPNRNIHAIQIEINRSLYMNETRIQKYADSFLQLQHDLSSIFLAVLKTL